MKTPLLTSRWTIDQLLCFLIPLLFFVTPLSSSAKSILMGIISVAVFLSPRARNTLKSMMRERWFLAGGVLLFVSCLGVCWSPAPLNEKALVLEKWAKLLALPLIMAGFQEAKTRDWALKSFVFAMLLTCMVSFFMILTGMFQTPITTPDSVFRNHIMTSMMMSFATYLSLWFCIEKKGKSRLFYAAISVLFSYHIIFINQSRSGYVIYVLLMGLFILQATPKRRAWLALVFFMLAATSVTYFSPVIQQRVQLAIHNLRTYEQDKNTSVGYRLQFHTFARQLFLAHPFIGGGTGSFTYQFRIKRPVPSWVEEHHHTGRLLEPHSQYWFIAAELGMLGLGAFALFYGELFLLARRLHAFRSLAVALLLMFAVGNLTDSLLFYSGSGYFFLLFFALCFSENMPQTSIVLHPNQRYLRDAIA